MISYLPGLGSISPRQPDSPISCMQRLRSFLTHCRSILRKVRYCRNKNGELKTYSLGIYCLQVVYTRPDQLMKSIIDDNRYQSIAIDPNQSIPINRLILEIDDQSMRENFVTFNIIDFHRLSSTVIYHLLFSIWIDTQQCN